MINELYRRNVESTAPTVVRCPARNLLTVGPDAFHPSAVHAVARDAAPQAHAHGAGPLAAAARVAPPFARGRSRPVAPCRPRAPHGPAGAHPGPDGPWHLGDELGSSLQGRRRCSSRDRGRFRRALRLDLGRLLDGHDRLRRAPARRDRFAIVGERRSTIRRSPETPAPRSSCRSATRRWRACSPGCAPPTSRSPRTGELEHFDFFVLSDSSDPDTLRRPSGTPGCELCRERRRLRPRLLPLAPHRDQAQERQRRRLLPALGQPATATWWCSTPTA